MTFAVIQYVLGGRWLGNAGKRVPNPLEAVIWLKVGHRLTTPVKFAIGGQVARLAGSWPLPTYFLTFGLASVALGLGAFMFTKHIRTLMAGIH